MSMDLKVLSLAKGYADLLALGITNVTTSGNTVTFTLADGSTATATLPKGDKGDKGDKFVYDDFTEEELEDLVGPKGDKGDRGVNGVGITSVEKQGTSGLIDTYKIIFSDGSETTFDVVNGANVTKTSQLINDNEFITKTVNNLVNYFTKDDVYNKSAIDELMRNVGAGLSIKIVETLPTIDISATTIYLIETSTSNYSQYMYIDNAWANLGSTTVDLSNYYTKEQIDNKLLGYITSDALTIALADYVKSSDLATVATSGSYYDLDDLPEIPSTDGFMKARQVLGEVDLNSCITEGTFTVTKTSSNLPNVPIYGTYCDLEVLSIETVVNQQLRIVVVTDDGNIPMLWDRSKIGDTWTEWVHALSNKVTTNTIVNDNKVIPSSKAVYDMINDTTSATDKVYSSSKVENSFLKFNGYITDGADLNNFTEDGRYYIQNIDLVNAIPNYEKMNDWGFLEVVSFSNYISQSYTTFVNKFRQEYVRRYYNGNWSDWKLANPDYYLTTETMTNKVWIDGKPIYRKVFTGLSFGIDTEVNVWHSTGAQLTNSKELVSAIAICSNNGSVTNGIFSRFDFRLLNNSIDYVNTASVLGTAIDTLIVEYTKAD